jgi:hypothetical protein
MKLAKIAKYVMASSVAIISFAGSVLADKDDNTTGTTKDRSHHKRAAEPAASPSVSPKEHSPKEHSPKEHSPKEH